MKVKVRKLTLIAMPLIVLFSLFAQCNIWLVLSILLLICIFNHYSFNFTENIFYLFFLITFFTFMMSAQIAHDYFGSEMKYVSRPEDFSFLNFCIFLSLVFLAVGHMFGKYASRRHAVRRETWSLAKRKKEYGFVSKYIFYAFSIPWYIVLIEQCIVVQTSKYVDLYTFESTLPGIVIQLSEACPIAFCLFLATFPTKREARLPMAIVMLYAGISLLNGRRLFFVTYLFLLVVYMSVRTFQKGAAEVWITRRQIYILLALIPVLIVFLYSYKYIRYDRDIEAQSFKDAFIGFFAQQGFSANLIVTARQYAEQLTDDIYSLYGTIRFLRINVFSRYVLGLNYMGYYFGNRTDQALLSGSFSRMMSFVLIPGSYSRGYGVGSCYIAELYHDFGYAGICLGNLIYGYVIGRFLRLNETTTFGNVAALMMFLQFLSVSRYNYDKVFSMFITFNFWAVIIIAYLGVEIIGIGKRAYKAHDYVREEGSL